MPWQPPAEERLRAVKRLRVLSWAVFAMFAFGVATSIVAVVGDPAQWWVFLIGLALFAYMAVRTAQRLRAANRALPRIEAEIRHQENTSSRTPPNR